MTRPHSSHRRRNARFALTCGTSLTTLGLMALAATPASAQLACSGTSTIFPPIEAEYDCTGSSNQTEDFSADIVTVDFDEIATVDTRVAEGGTGGTAVAISSRGGLIFRQAPNGGMIAGEGGGVVVQNLPVGGFATGGIEVITTGTIIGGTTGISAVNFFGGEALSITADGLVTGGTDGIVAANFGIGATEVTVSGDVTGITGDGIRVFNGLAVGSPGITLRQAAPGTITGGDDGIDAENSSGSMDIFSVGTIVGLGDAGIDARNLAGAEDLFLGVFNVTGEVEGIRAVNEGSGSLIIDASGAVTGLTGNGINALVGAGGTDLAIAAATVQGDYIGIRADNFGSGLLRIDTTGPVTGSDFDGIFAFQYDGGTDVIVQAGGDVTGGYRGIFARNDGIGSTFVRAEGVVTGARDAGVTVLNSAAATGDVTVLAFGDVTGTRGISARNLGSGALNITADGVIAGTRSTGILASTGGAGTDTIITARAAVEGATDGIVVTSEGTGLLGLELAANVIGGNGDGVRASSGATVASLQIYASDVSGTEDGIDAFHGGTGGLIVTAAGLASGGIGNGITAIAGAASEGIYVGVGNASGGTHGIYGSSIGTGDVRIFAEGSVSGIAGTGILAQTAATSAGLGIEAQGDVSGGTNGIFADHSGTGPLLLTATGTVSGGEIGILALAGPDGTDLTIDAGSVTGGQIGILARNDGSGALAITAAGPVTGTLESGIEASNDTTGTSLSIRSEGAVRGGEFGIRALNDAAGPLSIVANGGATGDTDDAIRAYNIGTSLSIETRGVVLGGNDGIDAENFGTAGLSIAAYGDVTGSGGNGVQAFNSAADVTSSMAIYHGPGTTVTGANDGIDADNAGGSLTITALGSVIGQTGDGIQAINRATATDLTINANVVSGAAHAIRTQNLGTGATRIATTGALTGGTGDGIWARGAATTTDLVINAAGPVSGRFGIRAFNDGSGATSVVTTGDVTGTEQTGLLAEGAGTSLTILTQGSVTGGFFGISARNSGTGNTLVQADGPVTGGTGSGIFAINEAGSGDLAITVGDVTGANGIRAINEGTGALVVESDGIITGTDGYGLWAENETTGTDLVLRVNAVSGADNGIIAENYDNGALVVTADGPVSGGAGSGLLLFNSGSDLFVELGGDVTGAVDGLNAVQEGSGDTTISTGGMVDGGTGSAIRLEAVSGGAVSIANTGTLTSEGPTISIAGTGASIANSGTITGNVVTDGGADLFANTGLFAMTRDSDFGGGADAFENSGTVRVTGAIALDGLEQFANVGLIDLADGASGGSLSIVGDYGGSGGIVALDVDLSAMSADNLVIGGAATGSTALDLAIDGAVGAFGSILLIDAGVGTGADAFSLANAMPVGFVDYTLEFAAGGNDFLLAIAPAAAAYDPLRIGEGAMQLWYRSADAWATQMEASRAGAVAPVWVQFYGHTAERDGDGSIATETGSMAMGLDYDQDFFGAQAGLEFGAEMGPRFGLTGGYLSSQLRLDGTGGSGAHFDVLNIGVYASVGGNEGFFASVLGKYDRIDGEAFARSPSYRAELDGDAWGARLLVGYRAGSGSFFIEPTAGIEYQRTELDPFGAYASSFEFSGFDGLRGTVGGRVGTSFASGVNAVELSLGAQAVHEFDGEGHVTFTTGAASDRFTDEAPGTYARFDTRISISGPGPVNGFIAATADLGEDVKGFGGRAGLSLRF